jgi:hypothetical protein
VGLAPQPFLVAYGGINLGAGVAMGIGLKRGGPRAGNLNKSFLSRKSREPAEISVILVKKGKNVRKNSEADFHIHTHKLSLDIFS